MRDLEREASRLAREIEGEETQDLHLAEVMTYASSYHSSSCFPHLPLRKRKFPLISHISHVLYDRNGAFSFMRS